MLTFTLPDLTPVMPLARPLARRTLVLNGAHRYFLPWVWRHARGQSSGDGRGAKRPDLVPL